MWRVVVCKRKVERKGKSEEIKELGKGDGADFDDFEKRYCILTGLKLTRCMTTDFDSSLGLMFEIDRDLRSYTMSALPSPLPLTASDKNINLDSL